MDYRTTIELKGFFKDAFCQVLEEIELQLEEMPQGRQDVVVQLMSNQHLEDGTLLLGLMGSNKQEKPLVLDMLSVALNGAIEMAKAEEDGQELKRLAKYQQTLLLFKNTNVWDTSIVDAADDEEADAEQ
ncbi:hypothetical protein GCM10011502_08760 [Oceanisphaera marina]|uniref:Uncharacterized protein n=1 Tax=Oceanisphaera marina TaxID=2017550 RepID=A0ABQ1IEP3_9GAMM|nr:hypothetical protein [Oceanisphaera marina]GGB37767.1 hypothetical protein GCM10011502_08760 [Oceanisphaera marina]